MRSIARSGRSIGSRLALLLALGGCDVGDYLTASSAPALLIGLTANDLRLCAGLPDRTALGTGARSSGPMIARSPPAAARMSGATAIASASCAPRVQTCVGMIQAGQPPPP
jgi:hypothetical protein